MSLLFIMILYFIISFLFWVIETNFEHIFQLKTGATRIIPQWRRGDMHSHDVTQGGERRAIWMVLIWVDNSIKLRCIWERDIQNSDIMFYLHGIATRFNKRTMATRGETFCIWNFAYKNYLYGRTSPTLTLYNIMWILTKPPPLKESYELYQLAYCNTILLLQGKTNHYIHVPTTSYWNRSKNMTIFYQCSYLSSLTELLVNYFGKYPSLPLLLGVGCV